MINELWFLLYVIIGYLLDGWLASQITTFTIEFLYAQQIIQPRIVLQLASIRDAPSFKPMNEVIEELQRNSLFECLNYLHSISSIMA
jgi:hypothetical protein